MLGTDLFGAIFNERFLLNSTLLVVLWDAQLLKANNLKLQNEVAALQRRLAEVEVVKDTKGTFIFGGGRTTNVALRRGVRFSNHGCLGFNC